jgi:ABC-type multidrug transport system fused ATPase/permease subunit
MAGGKIRSFFKSRQNITLALKVYETLSRQSQRKIKAIIPVYLGLAILDLIGVILLASCGTLAFNLVSGDSRPSRIELFIQKYISIDVDIETLIFLFAVSAGVFLISKTMIQALVNFRMIKWLANQESIFSINLFTSLLRAPLSEIQKINIGEAQWAIMIGSSRIVSGVVAPLVTVLGDIISMLFLLITLLVATPEITLLLIVLLVVSQRSYSIWLRGRLKSYGLQSAEKAAALNQEIIQSFNAVKEIKIYSLIESISTYFIKEKNVVSLVGQKSSFLNNLFKVFIWFFV